MKKLNYFSLLCTFFLVFYSSAVFAQRIKCGGKLVKIPLFYNDSTYTYDNQFVQYNALPNIKKSKNSFEIRMYTFGVSSSEGTAITLYSDGINMRVAKKKVFFNKSFYGPGLTPIFKNNEITANMISSPEETVAGCDFINEMIKNDLFVFHSSVRSEFKPINGVMPGIDAQEQYIFEIKVEDCIRNFQYTNTYGYEDTVIGRRKKIDQILDVFKNLSKSK